MVQTIRKGYKQTEIGVIPEDWKVASLGNLGLFRKGKGIKKDEVISDGLQCVRYGELYTTYNYLINETKSYISTHTADNSTKIKKGDILFAGSGETKEEIGKCATLISGKTTFAGGDIIILTPYETNSVYLGYLLNEVNIQKQKSQKGQGDAVVHIYSSGLSKIQIPLPPTLAEQKAIAQVLSDSDQLIQNIKTLIAKKKDIKRGTMQELLKPKENWISKKMKDISIIGRGRVISHKEIVKAKIKKYPVYSSQTVNSGIMGYLDTYEFEGEYLTWTTDGENAGTVFYRDGKFNCTNVCGTIKIVENNPKFISYILSVTAPKYVSRNLANPKLMNEPMKNIVVSLPLDIKEQKAIAKILSDMDAEIEALEIQLQKTQNLKQGMMQELLTGKTRLLCETETRLVKPVSQLYDKENKNISIAAEPKKSYKTH